jgi:predicted regulator of Ras-like GTPase activity (Roadblock/LC7/MglB family)
MLANNVEDELTKIFNSQDKIQTICLLNSQGILSLFLSRKNFEESEKSRLVASIMASVVLAERSIKNIVQEKVTKLIIQGDHAINVIFTTKDNRYICVLASNDFEYKTHLIFDSEI